MVAFITVEDSIHIVKNLPEPCLVAIDGLPCSGKTTLAEALKKELGAECIYLDDFVRPLKEWPRQPSFPFQYMYYDDFVNAVRGLSETGRCSYFPLDWDRLLPGKNLKTVSLKSHVIVEGISVLNPVLMPFYDLKFFVESDRATTLEAAMKRDGNEWEQHWRNLFLPSVDLYMASDPASRADYIVKGRM